MFDESHMQYVYKYVYIRVNRGKVLNPLRDVCSSGALGMRVAQWRHTRVGHCLLFSSVRSVLKKGTFCSFPFFYKEQKRTQRLFRSFENPGILPNILHKVENQGRRTGFLKTAKSLHPNAQLGIASLFFT